MLAATYGGAGPRPEPRAVAVAGCALRAQWHTRLGRLWVGVTVGGGGGGGAGGPALAGRGGAGLGGRGC